jgi:hypothetical protein
MATDRRFLDDKQSLNELLEFMPQRERVEYQGFRWLSMEPAFPGRKMVVYTIGGGRPTNIDVISFGEIAVGIKEMPTARMFYRNRDQLITPIPSRIADRDVFISIPQHFEFRWAGQEFKGELEFRAHYAVLIKSQSRDALNIEGHTYCVTLKRFLDAHPQLADEVRF